MASNACDGFCIKVCIGAIEVIEVLAPVTGIPKAKPFYADKLGLKVAADKRFCIDSCALEFKGKKRNDE
ncbi:MAG: hypothetical protein JSV10_01155 [Candidatus Zixiibacteriota bacterium]|nr:MAG: hypothetical protein JSV10_01155 [candidate division Zixibacteria bacterium]